MGLIVYEFEFDNGLPPLELVVRRLQEKTGLELQWERCAESAWTILHPSLRNDVDVVFKDKIVSVEVLLSGRKYLFWCVVAVLKELGGRNPVSEGIPRYASIRWPDKKWWQRIPN